MNYLKIKLSVLKLTMLQFVSKILNPEGYLNRITGSKVMTVWLNWWILPVGGVASRRVCAQPVKQACFILK